MNLIGGWTDIGLLIRGSWIPNYCHWLLIGGVDIGGDGAGADGLSDILLQCVVLNPKLFGINMITTIALCSVVEDYDPHRRSHGILFWES